jgi:hypothetical protein
MPAVIPMLQKHFRLMLTDGIPNGTVELSGTGHTMKCCPLCGCMHQIEGMNDSVPYTPLCETLPTVFKAQQMVWRKLHPEVAKYSTLHLSLNAV